jgi:four helix bundle protein
MGGDFVDLVAWRESVDLAVAVVAEMQHVRGPSGGAAADQMIRAAESIPANIAEGYGRGPGKDCARFLRTARASAAELESHLHVARRAQRLPADSTAALIGHTRRVRYLVHRLLTAIEARSRR